MNKWSFYTSKEIKPEGLLRRQLEIQPEELSGNLHKIWPDIRDSGWIGGDREGWERVPYWLDGFIPLAYLLENEEMIGGVKKYIDAILAAQDEDGWICPCKKEERAKYDTWAIQLICKTLKVYYDCSGDKRIPYVIYRVLKNYYEMLKSGESKLFKWAKFRWFETFISLNFLYEKYNEEWVKDLAKIIKEQGFDYYAVTESWKKPSHMWLRKTHIVNIAMMLKSEAVSHELLGEEHADNAEKLREILDRYNGTAFEGFIGDEVRSGLDPTRGTECCALMEKYCILKKEHFQSLYTFSIGRHTPYEIGIPLVDISDKTIEEIYYFRFHTYCKHIRDTKNGYVVTEFLPKVLLAGKHNTAYDSQSVQNKICRAIDIKAENSRENSIRKISESS